MGPPTPAASYPTTGSSSMTTASVISMGQPLQSPHASTTSTSTPQSSTTTIAAASSSEGQEDNNTKEKLSLTKTNSDETTEVEKHPRPSQPLRPSCLSPQAKEWGLCLLLLLRQNTYYRGLHTSKISRFLNIEQFIWRIFCIFLLPSLRYQNCYTTLAYILRICAESFRKQITLYE